MMSRSLHDDASSYFVPFLLGNTVQAQALSAKIFFKYGIRSVIVSDKRSLLEIANLSNSFAYISQTDSEELICEQLIAISGQLPYTLPLLVLCSQKYKSTVQNNTELLERFFVICDADELFSSSPLSTIN